MHWSLRNATSGRHPRADEPAGAVGRSSRGHLARHRAGHHRSARLPNSRRNTLEGKGQRPIPAAIGHLTGVWQERWCQLMLDSVKAGRLSWRASSTSPGAGRAAVTINRHRAGLAEGSDAEHISRLVDLSGTEPAQQMGGLPAPAGTAYDGMVSHRGWRRATLCAARR